MPINKSIKTVVCHKCGEEFDIFSPGQKKIPETSKICLRCESGESPDGYVKKALNDYKKVGDLALARRDSFSKLEKEAKDKEYADSSRLAAHKLDMEKRGAKQYNMNDEVRREVLSNPDKRLKYIMTGET